MAKKKAFGGYSISFKGCERHAGEAFGSTPIGPSVMTKKLWAYVKRKRLGKSRKNLGGGLDGPLRFPPRADCAGLARARKWRPRAVAGPGG